MAKKLDNQVRVRSRLPYGLILELGKTRVELKGLNSTTIVGSPFATTLVDTGFWTEWTKKNAGSKLLTSGVIFAENSLKSAKSAAKDMGKTGLEAADPEDFSVETLTEE